MCSCVIEPHTLASIARCTSCAEKERLLGLRPGDGQLSWLPTRNYGLARKNARLVLQSPSRVLCNGRRRSVLVHAREVQVGAVVHAHEVHVHNAIGVS